MTVDVTFNTSSDLEVVFLESETLTVDFSSVVARIPPNYGLITWDGREITVS